MATVHPLSSGKARPLLATGVATPKCKTHMPMMIAEAVVVAAEVALVPASNVMRRATLRETAPIRTRGRRVDPWSALSATKRVTWQEIAPIRLPMVAVGVVAALALSVTKRVTLLVTARAPTVATLTSALAEKMTMVDTPDPTLASPRDPTMPGVMPATRTGTQAWVRQEVGVRTISELGKL